MEERIEVGADETPEATGSPGPSPTTTGPAAVIWTIGVVVAVVLTVTAAAASFVVWTDYLPDAAIASCDLDTAAACDARDGAARAADWRLAAVSGVAILSLVLGMWGLVRALRTRSGRAVGATVAALVAATLAVLTGSLGTMSMWDQVALRNVEAVGPTRFRGLGWLFDERADSVRFVLVAGAEVGVDTMRRWVALTVGSAVGAVALLAVALFLLRPTAADRPEVQDPNL